MDSHEGITRKRKERSVVTNGISSPSRAYKIARTNDGTQDPVCVATGISTGSNSAKFSMTPHATSTLTPATDGLVCSGSTPRTVNGIRSSSSFTTYDQAAMLGADLAPTPRFPAGNMPETPACRNHGVFQPTPEGLDQTPKSNFPTDPTIPNASMTKDQAIANGSNAAETPRATPLNIRSFGDWNVSSRYQVIRLLGKGSYGQVAEAYDSLRQRKVAIKKIVNVFDQEIDCKRLHREIYILRHLKHPQVISLLDVIPPDNYETFTDLYLVFEFLDTDLHKLIMSPQYLTIRHIQVFLYQLLCGLKYIHSANVIHRDMKPANILLNEDCTLMIGDFGLSRVMDGVQQPMNLYSPKVNKSPVSDSTTPNSTPGSTTSTSGDAFKIKRSLTKHVVTRWYRAPELILLQDYTYAVDMWSIGCIFAELLSMQVENCPLYQNRVPLFPGRSCFPLSADRPTTYSDKLDQLNVIFNVIGTPSESDIGSLGEVKQYLQKLDRKDPQNLQQLFPGAPLESLDLLKQMLMFNPDARITVDKALEHPFIQEVRRPQSELVETKPLTMDYENVDLDKAALKALIFEEIKLFSQMHENQRL